jgi:hypothetical protein
MSCTKVCREPLFMSASGSDSQKIHRRAARRTAHARGTTSLVLDQASSLSSPIQLRADPSPSPCLGIALIHPRENESEYKWHAPALRMEPLPRAPGRSEINCTRPRQFLF